MNSFRKAISYFTAGCALGASLACAATNDLSATLQNGLFEEEANHDLSAAVRAYEAVVSRFDQDRKLAATAVFRLAECYRKQGRTNEATIQYERVLREFSDQTDLSQLSRQNLVSLGGQVGAGTTASPAATQEQKRFLQRGIADLELKLTEEKKRFTSESPNIQIDQHSLVELKRQLAALDSGTSIQAMAATDAARATSLAEDVEVRRIQSMLKESPDLINANNPQAGGNTLLQTAAADGRLEVAKFLLANGADVEARNPNFGNRTALHYAAAAGHKTMVELLLSKGANVNEADADGYTALHRAVENGYRNLVEGLLKYSAEVNAKTRSGATPLHIAAANGFPAIAEFLMAHGADINAVASDIRSRTGQNYSGTALHVAVQRDDQKLTQLLLDNKANVEAAANSSGQTPLYLAAEYHHTAIASLLLSRGANVNCRDQQPNRKWTPLVLGIYNCRTDLVTLLLTNNADPNITFSYDAGGGLHRGWTPLLVAVTRRCPAGAELLLKANAKPNEPSELGELPIFVALSIGDDPVTRTNILKLLLDHGAAVEVWDAQQQTPLLRASLSADLATLELLLAYKANPKAANKKSGMTALHFLAHRFASPGLASTDIPEMARALINAGADVNALDNSGNTPLSYLLRGQSQLRTPTPGASSEATIEAARKEFAALLRQHGAVTDLPRPDRIQIRRPADDYSKYIFEKSSPDWNRFTLLELLAVEYGLLESNPSALSYKTTRSMVEWAVSQKLGFPDFAHITIRQGAHEQRVDLSALFENGDCSKDQLLEWGEVVDVPEAEHPLNQQWDGFTGLGWQNLVKCLSREVQVVVKGKKTAMSLAPSLAGAYFWLKPVLLHSGLVLTTSDVSRVKVSRRDPTTYQTREWVIDCSQGAPAPDFWLRDGDVIEVPEK